MEIETTDRGFGIAKFVDQAGSACSIQDSSLGSEACIWFGLASTSKGRGRDGTTRMHLTLGQGRKVALAMKAARAGEPVESTTFIDRYGSTCSITSEGLDDGALVAIGVAVSFEGNVGIPMQLGHRQIEWLMPAMLAFLTSGYIAGEIDPEVLHEAPKPSLDVKIPVSMLDRTDIGETGVSARELLDAFRHLYDASDDLRASIGHDDAQAIEELNTRLQHIPVTE